MRTAEDAAVNEALEEAGEDLLDAETLARRAGGTSMALYHSAQAAEKYLAALAVAAERTVNPMWDLRRVFDAVRDIEGMEAVEEPVAMLSEFGTPAKRATVHVGPGEALRAVRKVRREVLVRLGVDVPPEPEPAPAPTPSPTPPPAAAGEPEAVADTELPVDANAATAPTTAGSGAGSAPESTDTSPADPDPATIGAALPDGSEEIDRAVVADAPEPEREFPGVLPEAAWSAETGGMSREQAGRRGPQPAGRGAGERRTSYVKVFLMCAHCGVRIPRTRQTAKGRVPCPQCGRPMQPVQ
jgi:hypothetical protein